MKQTAKSKLYDLLYDEADKLFKEYNPCNIRTDDKGRAICSRYHYGYDGWRKLCCGHCLLHIDGHSCPVKCLSCKLFVCEHILCRKKEHKEFLDKLNKLRDIAFDNEIPTSTFFTRKGDVFTKSGSVRKRIPYRVAVGYML